jgi:hypothetical protein
MNYDETAYETLHNVTRTHDFRLTSEAACPLRASLVQSWTTHSSTNRIQNFNHIMTRMLENKIYANMHPETRNVFGAQTLAGKKSKQE